MNLYKSVPRGTILQLEKFKELLLKWNKRVNLISRNDEELIDERHIADSMELLNYLPTDKSISILDLGSGAGFPGLILRIFGYGNITLVEADQKKSIFLKDACACLGLKCIIENERIESINPIHKYDVITARALSSISKLLEYSEKFLHNNTKLLLLKGQNLNHELQEAKKEWEFSCRSYLSNAPNGSGFVIELLNISKKNGK